MHATERLFIPSKSIATATPTDLAFIIDLQKKFSNQLGFLPTAALEWYLANDRVILATENDTPAGYLLGRERFRWQPLLRPITQAAIHFDAQRQHLGLALLRRIEDAARTAGQVGVQCSCRQGIEANEFWEAAGFEKTCELAPPTARGRKLNVWRKLLSIQRPLWFDAPPPVAGWKAKKACV